MFGFLNRDRVKYDPSHNWLNVDGTWFMDDTALKYDFENNTLEVILAKDDSSCNGYYIVRDKIYFRHSPEQKYLIIDSANYIPAKDSYINRTTYNQEENFVQDSPVGMIYNVFQQKFGAALPYNFSDKWDVFTSSGGIISIDLDSVDWNGSVIHLALRFDLDDDRRNESIIEIDVEKGTFRYIEAGVFDNDDDFRRMTVYGDGSFSNLNRDEADAKIAYDAAIHIQKNIDRYRDKQKLLDSGDSFYITRFNERMKGIIGMDSVKEALLKQYTMMLAWKQKNEQNGGNIPKPSMHMIFIGNPGSGKTKIARRISSIYIENGLLSNGNFVEVGRKDLISEYIGKTAQKVEEVFNSAEGGILFIDEAYSLTSENKNGTEAEAITTLVQLMENKKDSCAVILAGYRKEMLEFLEMNPGLKSRFPTIIDFPDYTPEELTEIVVSMLKKEGYQFESEEVVPAITKGLTTEQRISGANAGNGRLARNFYEKIKANQAMRLNGSVSDVIALSDIPADTNRNDEYDLKGELDAIIGMDSVKRQLRKLNASFMVKQRLGQSLRGDQSVPMIFRGNQGTGKTTMARILCDIYYNLGIIPKKLLVECAAQDLVAGYIGQTAPKTEKVFNSARGGILFIDEAYTLYSKNDGNDFGKEAIDALLKLMEDNRDSVIVILAGYPKEMDDFLNINPGLSSRFPTTIDFPDYSVDELLAIAEQMCEKQSLKLAPDAVEKLKDVFEKQKLDPHFGNARAVRNIIQKSSEEKDLRLIEELGGEFDRETGITIIARDITE